MISSANVIIDNVELTRWFSTSGVKIKCVDTGDVYPLAYVTKDATVTFVEEPSFPLNEIVAGAIVSVDGVLGLEDFILSELSDASFIKAYSASFGSLSAGDLTSFFVGNRNLDSILEDYATQSQLSDEYATKADLSSKADIESLTAYAQVSAVSSKLDQQSVAPQFDPEETYPANSYVTYLGRLYMFSQNHSGAWTGEDVVEADMTTPDATLDLNGNRLLVVSADGTVIWEQGYDLNVVSGQVSSLELTTDSVNFYAFAANDTSEVKLVLPTPSSGKIDDIIIDVQNPPLASSDTSSWPSDFSSSSTYAEKDVVSYDSKIWRCISAVTTAGSWTGSANWEEAWPLFTFGDALDNTMALAVADGDDVTEILSFEPGETSQMYLTRTAFSKTVSDKKLPVYIVGKRKVQMVEAGGAA